ncbi:MAG: cohesin domain-containing protein [Patescibacteria group bacterium]
MRSFAFKTLFSLIFSVVFLVPGSVFADTIFVSPITGTYTVGDTFSARIMVSSPGQAINAISGVLSFPIDKLQVVSVSKIGSVLSLWVQEPSFSNSRGTVTFEGVVPNPGFNESNGRVLGVNFRVVGTGSADIRLTSGSLLANDGYGTNILKNLGTASFSLEQKQEILVTPPAISESPEPPATETSEDKAPGTTFEFDMPSWKTLADWIIKFFSIVIPMLALGFFLVHTTKKGVGNIRSLKKNLRKDLHGIDRLIEKSFDLLKEDISDSIHILERARVKRRLTAEEDAVIHRLKQNLVDAEKIIHKEIIRSEKDIGD